MKPRRISRKKPRTGEGEEGARREFINAVAALTPEDVREKIEADRQAERMMPPQARPKHPHLVETVDLHGLTAEQAICRLRTALQRLAGGGGWVRVIVGKGNHSPDGVGVLRETIPAWLGSAGRAFAAEWHWARPREGGRGALIVRLRGKPSSEPS